MKKQLNALILVNAYVPELNTRQVTRIRDELTTLGTHVDVCRNDGFNAFIENGEVRIGFKKDYDFCVYLDKDKYVSYLLERRGLRLFNSAKAIEACDDKMSTHILLANSGIRMPDTLPGLLCYDAKAKINKSALDKIEAKFGYPVIVKHAFGSLGKGVFRADDRRQLNEIAESVKLLPHLYQKYVAHSCGKDLRVIVVGDRVLGGILRRSDGDFRSNIGLGGSATAADVPQSVKADALKAAKMLGLDYCGIDFLIDADGYLLCEVNSNAFFDAFEKATGLNVAAAYAQYMIESIR